VIQNFEGEHVGFVLMDFSADPSQDGIYRGHCVFMIVPQSKAVFDSPLCDRFYSYKDWGEHEVTLTIASGKREYMIFGSSLPVLGISTDDQGQGTLMRKGKDDEPIAKTICLSPEDKGVG
jgi:hypothetical protein